MVAIASASGAVSELAGRSEAVEDLSELREDAGHEVLEGARVFDPSHAHRLVPGVADQLLRDVARLLVGRI